MIVSLEPAVVITTKTKVNKGSEEQSTVIAVPELLLFLRLAEGMALAIFYMENGRRWVTDIRVAEKASLGYPRVPSLTGKDMVGLD